jgi:hypothetical protein
VVKADRFWAPESVKKELPDLIRKLFAEPELFGGMKMNVPGSAGASMQVKPIPYHHWSQEGPHVRVSCDMDITYMVAPSAGGRPIPKYALDGSIMVEGPASVLERTADEATPWRIVGLHLRRGQTPTATPGMPTPPTAVAP